MRKQHVSVEETKQKIIELVQSNPMTMKELGGSLCLSRTNSIHRYFPINGVGAVDWRYENGMNLTAVFGITYEPMTREQWYDLQGMPKNKKERAKIRAKKLAKSGYDPLDHVKSERKPTQKTNYVPERAMRRFVEESLLTTIVVDGIKYTRDMVSEKQMMAAAVSFGIQSSEKLTAEQLKKKNAAHFKTMRDAKTMKLNTQIVELLEDLPLLFTAKTIDSMVFGSPWPTGSSLIDAARRRELIKPSGEKFINSVEYVNPYHENYETWQDSQKTKVKKTAQEMRA